MDGDVRVVDAVSVVAVVVAVTVRVRDWEGRLKETRSPDHVKSEQCNEQRPTPNKTVPSNEPEQINPQYVQIL